MCFTLNTFSQIQNNLINIQGNAIISEIPELMVVYISVESQDSIYSKCSDKLINNYNILQKAFTENGISTTLKSNGLEIDENYSGSYRDRKRDGYKGKIKVTLKLPYNSEALNNVMNTLKANKFPLNYDLAFTLSEDQKKRLLNEAIELAIKDASTKARIIAKSLNVELSEIQDVNFGYTNYKYDILVAETLELDDLEEVGGKLPLNPKEIQIRKTIGIVWKIKE